jgi:hypothetical protein
MARPGQHHPRLVRRCERLYAERASAPKRHQRRITRQAHVSTKEYGIGSTRAGMPRRVRSPEPAPPQMSEPTQLTLA